MKEAVVHTMTSHRGSVCAKLCLLLLMWACRDASGRPPSPHDDDSDGYWAPNGSLTINVGPAAGGTVNIVVYPTLGRWSHHRNVSGATADIQVPPSTTSRPTTTRRTTHVTAADHHVKTTQPPSATTIGANITNIIIAPPIPRECPDGQKPDIANNCREEWPDFSRSAVGKSEYHSRSTASPKSTTRTSSVVHHTRKQRV